MPTYEGKPETDDLLVLPQWSVERARRFIAGVAASHGPLRYALPNGRSVRIVGLGGSEQTAEIVLRNGTLRVSVTDASVFPAHFPD
jgi:hypothetical protein